MTKDYLFGTGYGVDLNQPYKEHDPFELTKQGLDDIYKKLTPTEDDNYDNDHNYKKLAPKYDKDLNTNKEM